MTLSDNVLCRPVEQQVEVREAYGDFCDHYGLDPSADASAEAFEEYLDDGTPPVRDTGDTATRTTDGVPF